jgi:VHL beta domain/Family of unknown function (DUF6152)
MSDKVTVRFMTASAMGMNLLVWCVPSHAQHKLYDTSQTVTIEGEVASFAVGDEYATVSMFPLSEQKNSRTMWVVDWRSSGSLSGQGITPEWLKRGDRVMVTGHPHRSPGQRMMLLKAITRVSDGRKWADGTTSPSTPKAPATAAGQTPSPATPSPAVPDANDSPVPAGSSGPAPATAKTGSSTTSDVEPVSKAPPEQTETLAERQAKINQDVTAKTNSIVADLKKKAEAVKEKAAAEATAASQTAAQSTPPVTGQSVAPPAGPAWQPCGGELRSAESRTAVPVEFVNSSSQLRKLYWMDFSGTRKLYGTLQPGQRAPMQTYVTHSWIVTDSSDRCLGTIAIASAARLEIR